MLYSQSALLFLALCASATAQSKAERRQHDDSLLRKVQCGAVNFMVTGFLPESHAVAFCSAYLQIPEHTYTSTTTITASAATIIKTTNQIVPTLTRTVSKNIVSTTTATVDLWRGRPACSTPPNYAWINEPQRSDRFKSIALVEQACSCLSIPTSTSTVVASTTVTPTSTITQGITGRTEVTSTITHTAVETMTKFIFLVHEENQNNPSNESTKVERRDSVPSMVERGPTFEYNKSRSINSSEPEMLHATMAPFHYIGSDIIARDNKLRLLSAS